MPCLIVTTGQQVGKHFDLAKRPLSIGRDPSRDIQIIDPKVSRKHAMVRLEDDGYQISSIKALNGVMVNGKMIDGDQLLHDGDEIVLGETVLRFSVSSDANHTNALHHRKIADRAVRDNQTIM